MRCGVLRTIMHGFYLVVLSLAWLAPASAAVSLDYQLKARRIAPDVYVFVGANEDFSLDNGGNILNTGVILTDDGAIVINTGPSRLYGEQLRRAIAGLTDKPVIRVYISKLHPDHFLGNQAFRDVPIYASPRTIELLHDQAEDFTDNMYRLVGTWMRGTEPVIPTHQAVAGTETIGGHEIELLILAGHTPGDLVLLDHSRGVLFSGGVVFNQRGPTTPHADLHGWLDELQRLSRLDFDLLVPSHGPVAHDKKPIAETAAYIGWLDQTFERAARDGVSMAEALYLDIPGRFSRMAVMPDEYQRSVSHLYGAYEDRNLPLAKQIGGE
jgi:quinoprotein relay system zinc metallohydrolase 1